jgi:methylated-DNA-protein-cysteine methyltransferase related protein
MPYGLGLSEFTKAVIDAIRKIPVGKIATYKQIAELAGKPQASRGVAWILKSCSTRYNLPWHRVINSRGRISFDRTTHNYRQQKQRLKNEGVIFSDAGEVNLAQFQWKKFRRKKRGSKQRPRMFSLTKPQIT